MIPNRLLFVFAMLILPLAGLQSQARAQAEAYAWGNLRGIRVDGELLPFTTGLRAVPPEMPVLGNASLEKLSLPKFSRDETGMTVTGGGDWPTTLSAIELAKINSAARKLLSVDPEAKAVLDRFPGVALFTAPPVQAASGRNNLTARIAYHDTGPGVVKVDVQVTAAASTALKGVYYYIHLPADEYTDGSTELINPASPGTAQLGPSNMGGIAQGLRATAAHRKLVVYFAAPRQIYVQQNGPRAKDGMDIYFPIGEGNLAAGQTVQLGFTLTASGDVDNSPVQLEIDPVHPGSPFDGVGGNFRLQSSADPPQVQYNLDHLRVAFGRVNIPLNNWQPDENADPVADAMTGQLNNNVRQAMEMAQNLARRNIPLILTIWDVPGWAALAPTPRPEGGGGGSTSHLNPEKWDALCKSIGSYLAYLKQNYGVEAKYLSFNETDIGYDVLQTPEEHAEEIKQVGSYLASHGFPTKMLLGDTGDPTGRPFINYALNDPETLKYVGAVSYHSWRGGTIEQYTSWGEAAKKLRLPLIIGEGGTDSDAYRYQSIFTEPWYALNEISEYVDICHYSQPESILQWQLTENYSLLTGGANGAPLQPTQRFWQLSQLDLTPPGSAALPITCDKASIASCAYLDPVQGICTVHLVNTGPTRTAVIAGFPAKVKELRVYVTDQNRSMKEMAPVPITNGTAQFTLDSLSYVTLISTN